ncbi:MAG TPA: MiaB/RimO family radical SAM methylthiotransferase [Nannocystaceae bacterium]|nr:MiaB/RimO family radical SAM methylthiotransferase [Nannocystaceae bacterium]
MRAAIVGFGCRVNLSESDGMAAALRAAGWAICDVEAAEVVVVNGCAITEAAEADGRAAVRRAVRANPRARVVVTGCWAEASRSAALALPGVAVVVGNADKPDIVEHAARALERDPAARPDVAITRLVRGAPLRELPYRLDARARVLLKVQDGCDYRCSFCIVPSVRGPSRSLPLATIVARLDALVGAGVGEIVLTGIHLGTWGRDLQPRAALVDLVAALVPRLGPARLRLSSIDPHEVGDELLALLREHPRALCRHLHLPVQSCDDGVLRKMRRAHDAASFVELVARARAGIPEIAISSDVIVGHPGEDDEAFARTHATLAGLPLAYLHVFPWSPRRGTIAPTLPGRVASATIRARGEALRALSRAQAAAFRAALSDREHDVVVHRRPDRAGVVWARTDHDVAVRMIDGAAHAGARMRVHLGSDGWTARPIA